ncbi:hypothetical protein M432DRAFT_476724 [Thermoascus aurantiacus ATCC 26904]
MVRTMPSAPGCDSSHESRRRKDSHAATFQLLNRKERSDPIIIYLSGWGLGLGLIHHRPHAAAASPWRNKLFSPVIQRDLTYDASVACPWIEIRSKDTLVPNRSPALGISDPRTSAAAALRPSTSFHGQSAQPWLVLSQMALKHVMRSPVRRGRCFMSNPPVVHR